MNPPAEAGGQGRHQKLRKLLALRKNMAYPPELWNYVSHLALDMVRQRYLENGGLWVHISWIPSMTREVMKKQGATEQSLRQIGFDDGLVYRVLHEHQKHGRLMAKETPRFLQENDVHLKLTAEGVTLLGRGGAPPPPPIIITGGAQIARADNVSVYGDVTINQVANFYRSDPELKRIVNGLACELKYGRLAQDQLSREIERLSRENSRIRSEIGNRGWGVGKFISTLADFVTIASVFL